MALDLNDVEWNIAKQVLEGGTNANAVPLEGLDAHLLGGGGQGVGEF